MAVVLFFSICAVVLILGFGLTFFTVRHHYRLSRKKKS